MCVQVFCRYITPRRVFFFFLWDLHWFLFGDSLCLQSICVAPRGGGWMHLLLRLLVGAWGPIYTSPSSGENVELLFHFRCPFTWKWHLMGFRVLGTRQSPCEWGKHFFFLGGSCTCALLHHTNLWCRENPTGWSKSFCFSRWNSRGCLSNSGWGFCWSCFKAPDNWNLRSISIIILHLSSLLDKGHCYSNASIQAEIMVRFERYRWKVPKNLLEMLLIIFQCRQLAISSFSNWGSEARRSGSGEPSTAHTVLENLKITPWSSHR